MFNGKQCTIQWYVYENHVTHISEDVITGVIVITRKHFGELFLSHEKKNDFLGMDIELVKGGKIKIGIQSYIKEAIEKFGKDV